MDNKAILIAMGYSEEQINLLEGAGVEESTTEIVDETNEQAEETAGSEPLEENILSDIDNSEIITIEDTSELLNPEITNETPLAEMVEKLAYEVEIAKIREEIAEVRQEHEAFKTRFKFADQPDSIEAPEMDAYQQWTHSLGGGGRG